MGRLSLPSFDSGRLSIHFTCRKVNISMRVSIRIRGSKCVQLSRQRSVITRFSLSILSSSFLLCFFNFLFFFSLNFSSLPFTATKHFRLGGVKNKFFSYVRARFCYIVSRRWLLLLLLLLLSPLLFAVTSDARGKKAKKRREKEGERERERERDRRWRGRIKESSTREKEIKSLNKKLAAKETGREEVGHKAEEKREKRPDE